jgi:hypothetical protein
MALWLSGQVSLSSRLASRAAGTLVAVCVAFPTICEAQTISSSERDALVRLRVERGGRPDDVDALVRHVDEAAAKGLPAHPLTNKIREGLAKGYDPERIAGVVRQMTVHLETADRLLRELQISSSASDREPQVILLADALGTGLTPNDVAEIKRQAETSGKSPVSAEGLAGAAKGLSFIKAAGLPVSDGTAVMVEAVRQGFRSFEMLDLGREIKRRERDYREGRASLIALRDAIARTGRSEPLFRDTRPVPVERPAATRPEPTDSRPEAVTPVDRPQRPERPVRPERAERPDSGGTRTR